MPAPAPDTDTPAAFAELDACHQQIHAHLDRLATLATRLQLEDASDEVRAEAGAIEAFFSGTSRQHHADEELRVFPPLLASGDAALVSAVRTLQQDHGWIEENWLELGPQLAALSEGNHWVDPAEFLHGVEVFHELVSDHIALEESLIYPEAKARWERALAQRHARATS
jgi:iron-sulfur cluster repair protein YtfE (RIC family)